MTFTFEVNWFLATVWLGALTFLWLVTTLFLTLSIRSLKRRTTETTMAMHDMLLEKKPAKRKTTRKPAAKKAAPAPAAMPKAAAPAWETLKASPEESKPTLVNAPNLDASTGGFSNN